MVAPPPEKRTFFMSGERGLPHPHGPAPGAGAGGGGGGSQGPAADAAMDVGAVCAGLPAVAEPFPSSGPEKGSSKASFLTPPPLPLPPVWTPPPPLLLLPLPLLVLSAGPWGGEKAATTVRFLSGSNTQPFVGESYDPPAPAPSPAPAPAPSPAPAPLASGEG